MKIPIRIVIRAVNIYPWKQICTTIIGWLQYVTSSTTTAAAAAKSLAAPNRIIILRIHMQIRWKTENLNHSTHPILCADMSKLLGICIWESHVQMVQAANMNGTHMVSVIGIDMRYLCITHIFKQINITYHRYIAFRLCVVIRQSNIEAYFRWFPLMSGLFHQFSLPFITHPYIALFRGCK